MFADNVGHTETKYVCNLLLKATKNNQYTVLYKLCTLFYYYLILHDAINATLLNFHFQCEPDVILLLFL